MHVYPYIYGTRVLCRTTVDGKAMTGVRKREALNTGRER